MSKEVVKPECATSERGKPVEDAKVPQCKYDINNKDNIFHGEVQAQCDMNNDKFNLKDDEKHKSASKSIKNRCEHEKETQPHNATSSDQKTKFNVPQSEQRDQESNVEMQDDEGTKFVKCNACWVSIDNKTAKHCVKCNAVTYCGKHCQRQHWDNHKVICSAI